jgi:hypothetical protein
VIAQILAMVVSSWLKGRSKGLGFSEARGFFESPWPFARNAHRVVMLAARAGLEIFGLNAPGATAASTRSFAD